MADDTDEHGVQDPRVPAALMLLGHTGADKSQVRYCEEETPVVWIAAACWGDTWEAAAGMTPRSAVFRLCDQVVDGGTCVHCRRPTGFSPDWDPMPLSRLICWYKWDPELQVFRRSCEGETGPGKRKSPGQAGIS
jgi:hypothetical protein